MATDLTNKFQEYVASLNSEQLGDLLRASMPMAMVLQRIQEQELEDGSGLHVPVLNLATIALRELVSRASATDTKEES